MSLQDLNHTPVSSCFSLLREIFILFLLKPSPLLISRILPHSKDFPLKSALFFTVHISSVEPCVRLTRAVDFSTSKQPQLTLQVEVEVVLSNWRGNDPVNTTTVIFQLVQASVNKDRLICGSTLNGFCMRSIDMLVSSRPTPMLKLDPVEFLAKKCDIRQTETYQV